MCSHKLTAGTYRNCYSELALSLKPSLLSHCLLRAAVVSSEALVHEEPGPGADSPLRGIPLWSRLPFPADFVEGGGWWGKQWVTAVPFSGGGSSGQATEGFCPYTTSRKERLHGHKRGPPSQGPSLTLPKGMYKQWLEVFLDSLGASSLAPQKMGSSVRKAGSRVPQRAWPSW